MLDGFAKAKPRVDEQALTAQPNCFTSGDALGEIGSHFLLDGISIARRVLHALRLTLAVHQTDRQAAAGGGGQSALTL